MSDKYFSCSIVLPSVLWRFCTYSISQAQFSNRSARKIMTCFFAITTPLRHWDRNLFILQLIQRMNSCHWRHLECHVSWYFGLYGLGGSNCCWFSKQEDEFQFFPSSCVLLFPLPWSWIDVLTWNWGWGFSFF